MKNLYFPISVLCFALAYSQLALATDERIFTVVNHCYNENAYISTNYLYYSDNRLVKKNYEFLWPGDMSASLKIKLSEYHNNAKIIYRNSFLGDASGLGDKEIGTQVFLEFFWPWNMTIFYIDVSLGNSYPVRVSSLNAYNTKDFTTSSQCNIKRSDVYGACPKEEIGLKNGLYYEKIYQPWDIDFKLCKNPCKACLDEHGSNCPEYCCPNGSTNSTCIIPETNFWKMINEKCPGTKVYPSQSTGIIYGYTFENEILIEYCP